jgi:hypothetical protein
VSTEVSERCELVYHHTDHGGATGILSSTTFRFSAIEYLNDSAERTYVVTYINDCIAREEEKYKNDDRMLDLLRELRRANQLVPSPYYIGCFTQSLNELSQWRGYSRTVPSYAIAFKRDALVNATKQVLSDNDLGSIWAEKVEYGGPKRAVPRVDKFIQGRIDAMLRFIEQSRDKVSQEGYRNYMRSHAANVADSLSLDFMQKQQPAFVKHEAFLAENEFRIAIRYSSPAIGKTAKFGVTAGIAAMKPYIELTYGKEVMRSIIDHMIVGPTPEEKLACRALEQYRASLE